MGDLAGRHASLAHGFPRSGGENTVFEELTALAKIADIDTTALQTETELKQIPERIASLQGDVGRLEALLEAERQELAEAERLLKTAEQEISNQHDALSRCLKPPLVERGR